MEKKEKHVYINIETEQGEKSIFMRQDVSLRPSSITKMPSLQLGSSKETCINT